MRLRQGSRIDDPPAVANISLTHGPYVFAGFLAFLLLSSCSPEQANYKDGNLAATPGASSITVDVPGEVVEADVANNQHAATGCRDLDGAPCRERLFESEAALEDEVKEKRPPALSLCWEGYCPCESPQGGPDQLLCDQLRIGDIDPRMLSVGKSMRETRRQIDTYEF